MSEVNQLQKQLDDSKKLIERRRQAIRLSENKDFKKLILEGFCVSDAASYVSASADPQLTLEQRADALNIAQAGGHLKRFLSVITQMGAVAERDIANIEDAIVSARAEETE